MPYKNFSIEWFLQKKILFIIVSLLTILGALLIRIYGLSDIYYGSDEAWHLVIASQPTVKDVLQYNFQQEIHPPLSVLIWHFMLQISDNDVWMRSASYIPSILIIPSVFIFGCLLFGEAAGFIMAMIAAFGFLPVSIGVVIRAYPMMMLCLVWAAIFVLKYRKTALKKYLAFYFIAMFLTLQLNHAAALAAFVLGTALIYETYKHKAKAAFIFAIFGSLILASITIGYEYILKHYYNFETTYYVFAWNNSFAMYLIDIVYVYYKIIVSCVSVFFLKKEAIESLIVPLVVITPLVILKFLRKKDFLLLNIIFTPFILILLLDYFRIYPFYNMPRSNSYIFLSAITLFGYIGRCLYEYFGKSLIYINKYSDPLARKSLFQDKDVDLFQVLLIILYNKILKFCLPKNSLRIIAAVLLIALPVSLTLYNLDNDYIRYNEAEWSKEDMKLAVKTLKDYQVSDNILVTENDMVWQALLFEKLDAEVTYITKYLGHFKSKNYDFYFTAFPGREYNVYNSLYKFSAFLTDLFSELKKQGKLASVKNIVYFSFGEIAGFGKMVDLKMIPTPRKFFGKEKYSDQLYQVSKQQDDLSWQIYSSKQVSKILSIHSSHQANNDKYAGVIYLIAMSPKFVEDNILNKNFVDAYDIAEKAVFDFHGKPY